MYEKVSLRIKQDELKALQTLASSERRDFRSQAAYIIRQELIRQGLLPAEGKLSFQDVNSLLKRD
jgi:hypothetical protein